MTYLGWTMPLLVKVWDAVKDISPTDAVSRYRYTRLKNVMIYLAARAAREGGAA